MAALDIYRTTQGTAYPGMLANMEPKTIITRTNEDAAVAAFGRAVFQGVADMGGTMTPTAGKFVGITVIDRAAYVSADLETEGFRKGDNMRILRRGVIWVIAGGAVKPRDSVFAKADGTFVSAATDGAVEVPGATFDTTTTATGEMVKVRIDQ